MAKQKILVGVAHKNGSMVSERDRALVNYDNIVLHIIAEMDEPKDPAKEMATGYQCMDEIKIKWDTFADIAGILPSKFLDTVGDYLNKPVKIFFDEKQKPAMVQFLKVNPKTGEVG